MRRFMDHNKAIRFCMALICLSVTAGISRAQYIEVRTELDTNQIRIGEILHLDIRLHQPAGIYVEFPHLQDTVVKDLEILNERPADTTVSGEDLEILKRYRLTSFDSGLYVIPPLKFRYGAADWTDSIESDPLYMYVHTVATDSTIYDIKQPVNVPVGFMEVFPFVMGGIIIIAAIILLIIYLRRRKQNRPVFTPQKPQDPAHIIAFRELRELQEEKLWQKNEFKQYYSRLTEIVRRYLWRRYGVQAMEMTTYEILEVWNKMEPDKTDLTGKLRSLLNLADLVKFAKQKPVASENEENMESAHEFVESTKPAAPENKEE